MDWVQACQPWERALLVAETVLLAMTIGWSICSWMRNKDVTAKLDAMNRDNKTVSKYLVLLLSETDPVQKQRLTEYMVNVLLEEDAGKRQEYLDSIATWLSGHGETEGEVKATLTRHKQGEEP